MAIYYEGLTSGGLGAKQLLRFNRFVGGVWQQILNIRSAIAVARSQAIASVDSSPKVHVRTSE